MSVRSLPTLFVLLALSAPLLAQEAEIEGHVYDTKGDTLIGATVRVAGSVIGDVSDYEGFYRLGVPPGRIRLVATYIGYENFDTIINVTPNDRLFEVDIVMREEFTDIGEVIVFGRRATGQSQALRLQQSGITQQTIIHAELFNKYPDITLAETVQRMPGVTITRNRGEGELVQVRGLPEQYTAISLNGQRLPAVQPESDRAGSLDIIQSNLVEEVRVIKSRTADMDADAIGGTVDFHIREPQERFEVLLQGGLGNNFGFDERAVLGRGITQAAAVLNSELSDEAVYGLLAGSYFSHARGNREQRYDYGFNGVTGTDVTRIRPIDQDRRTEKYGVVGAVELRPSIYNRLRLSYNYSGIDEEVATREANFSREPRLENEVAARWREERSLGMVTLEVENNFSKTRLDYNLSFASTGEEVIDRQRSYTNNSLPAARPTIDFDNPQSQRFSPFQTEYDGGPVILGGSRTSVDLEEDVAIGGVNLTRFISRSQTSFVRVGGRYRIKERDYRSDRSNAVIRPFSDPFGDDFPDLAANPVDAPAPDLDGGHRYRADERIYAGYAMYRANWSARFSSSVGLRYERTDVGFENVFNGEVRIVEDDSIQYNDWFPSLSLNYRITRDRQLRFAYYEAIARVPYSTLVPTEGLTNRYQSQLHTYTVGNPSVVPTRSRNLDVTYERYGRRDGLFTLGAYAKILDNPTVRTAEFDYASDIDYPTLGFGVANTEDATLYGVEVGFYQNLGFLNTNLRFINVNGNFNANLYRTEDQETNTLAQAPRRTANLSLVYDNPRKKLNLVLAGNYRSSTLDYLQEGQPIWITSVIALDLAADYELFKGISLYARVNNLTDHGYERYIGKPDEADAQLTSRTQYGVWGVGGVRWRL